MDTTQRAIALLLKSAVTGQAEVLPEGFSIDDAIKQINRHHIVAAAYEGAVRCGISTQSPVMKELLRESYRLSIRSEKQLRAVERIFGAFEENGIDYMPVKGCVMKHLYPKTAIRLMGDADILIRTSQYDRIRPVMEALGFTQRLETDHVYLWYSEDLHVELHKCLVPPEDQDYHAYYGDGWKFAVRGQGRRHDLSVEDAYVFLFAHFARHYRYGGIGCRHVLDLFVYRRMHPGLDEAYISGELRKLRLLEFHQNMCRTLEVWFENAGEDPVTELITQFIFRSGNWGTLETYSLLQQAKKAKKAGSIRNNRAENLRTAIFPPLSEMRGIYAVLERHPILLPVMWVVRIAQVLLCRPKMIRRRWRVAKIITDEKVEAYCQSLEAVGLDYYFENE